MPAEAKPNPLAPPRRAQADQQMHPMKAHALVWRHVGRMDDGTLTAKSKQLDSLLPIVGELAGNPDVTTKDVIKAASQAAAEGIATPTEAVQFISSMPEEPDKLQGWLKGFYALQMSASVHMKARQMGMVQPAPSPAAAPAAGPSAPAPPTSMTPGEAS